MWNLFQKKSFESDFFSRKEIHKSLVYLHKRRERECDFGEETEDLTFEAFRDSFPKIRKLVFRAIKRKSFAFRPAEQHLVVADKEREIYTFDIVDQFVIVHLARLLNTRVLPILSDQIYSFRPGRNSDQALKLAAQFIKDSSGMVFVARRDIKSYGEEMDHELLQQDFKQLCGESECLEKLVRDICQFRYQKNGRMVVNKAGLPTGTFLQVVFENAYLRGLDSKLEGIPNTLYLRFGDDILFMATDKNVFDAACAVMQTEISDRKLRDHPKKSVNFVLGAPHTIPAVREFYPGYRACAVVSYLGVDLTYRGEVLLPTTKRNNIRDFLRKRLRGCARALPQSLPVGERVALLCSSAAALFNAHSVGLESPVRAYARITSDETSLHELDRWVALEVLSAACNAGFKKSLFKTFPPKRLRALGLPSLVHLRRTNVI